MIISAARDRTALDTPTEQLLKTETLDGSVVRQAIEDTRPGRELTMRLNDEIASRLEEAARYTVITATREALRGQRVKEERSVSMA